MTATVLTNNLDDLRVSVTVTDGNEEHIEWGKCQEPGCTNTCAKDATICYDHLALIFV